MSGFARTKVDRRRRHALWLIASICWMSCAVSLAVAAPLVIDDATSISVDNGLSSFVVAKSSGRMTSLALGSQELMGGGGTRGYFSANVGNIGQSGSTYWEMGFAGTTTSYTTGPDFVDIALSYPASSSMPYDVTQHYVLRDGETGFHVYAEVEHTTAMVAKRIEEMRFVLRGNPNLFTHHWVADDRFSIMPTPAELAAGTTVQDATDRLLPGTAYEAETGKDAYTKYDWSIGMDDVGAYGFYGANYGAWVVMPNKESLIGGPTKQELTVHQTTTTPVLLGMLVGQHYGTPGSVETPGDYDHTYGPFYVHLNSGASATAMQADAANYFDTSVHQAFYDSLGVAGWTDASQRSQVSGSLHFASGRVPEGATIALADNHTDVQFSKYGYQYWTHVAADGSFDLSGVRPGTYRMTAFSPGTFGELITDDLSVGSGESLSLGDVSWQPPNHGLDLWQIGRFDRDATEFRYGADNAFREYGLWENYSADFPDDVHFVVGQSDEATDWNFAHWERATDGHSPVWEIEFDEPQLPAAVDTVLTIAVAGQRGGNLQVRVNGTIVDSNWDLPYDGSVLSRSGIRGPYQSREITFSSSLLVAGTNTITLSHVSPGSSLTEGIVYDAIRLEIALTPGDYNADGTVDAADYTVWRNTIGSSQNLAADGNGDGVVDELDYRLWKQNFGQSTGSAGFASQSNFVPEPVTLWGGLIGTVAIGMIRRRRHKRAHRNPLSAPQLARRANLREIIGLLPSPRLCPEDLTLLDECFDTVPRCCPAGHCPELLASGSHTLERIQSP